MSDTPLDNDNETELSVEEAARVYKVSTRTIRRWLSEPGHGGLVARQLQTRSGFQWLITPPPGYNAEELPDNTDTTPEPSALIPLVQVEQRLAGLLAERDELRTTIQQLQQTRLEDAYRQGEQRVEDARKYAEEIGHLKGLLEAATTRLQELEAQQKTGELQRKQIETPLDTSVVVEKEKPRHKFFWQRS